jgi:hypothetical protein
MSHIHEVQKSCKVGKNQAILTSKKGENINIKIRIRDSKMAARGRKQKASLL